jgi:hypothetical protein
MHKCGETYRLDCKVIDFDHVECRGVGEAADGESEEGAGDPLAQKARSDSVVGSPSD